MSHILPISSGQPVIVFSDLDGTYIDHHSYSPEGSAAALKELQNRAWPLVFCSSKTFAEQVFLQQQLGLYAPFILENGSAVAILRDILQHLPLRLSSDLALKYFHSHMLILEAPGLKLLSFKAYKVFPM
ncbi:MAG: HAD-IIB family hydrolase [Lewinellaceae bacterium]|nr:HAD-IIB family hydrolase [Lewinellaceae bacterium]